MNKLLFLMLLLPLTSFATPEENSSESNIICPKNPVNRYWGWHWYECQHKIANNPFYTHTELDMPMSFMTPTHKHFTSEKPARLLIVLHRKDKGSGKYVTSPKRFHHKLDKVEIHDQEDSYSSNPENSLWGFSGNQSDAVENYNGRRISASISYVLQRFGNKIDLHKGLYIKGKNDGGTGALIQSITLPDYQHKIAIVEVKNARMLLSKCCKNLVAPAWGEKHFDEVDFRLQMDKVKNIHFHWYGKTNKKQNKFDLEFFELCEKFKISCSGVWKKSKRSAMPQRLFLDKNQDITLDSILPVITNSSANYHGEFEGHHNRGISWNHSAIVETETQIEIPLKYKPQRNISTTIPGQPETVTFSVTPRHLQKLRLTVGASVDWEFGDQSGSAVVSNNGLVTIDNLLLPVLKEYQILFLSQSINTENENPDDSQGNDNPGNDDSDNDNPGNDNSGSDTPGNDNPGNNNPGNGGPIDDPTDNIPPSNSIQNGIVYIRVPRTHGQYQVKLGDGSNYTLNSPDIWDRLPDAGHKFGNFNAPGQLVYQAPDGNEKILYDCFVASIPCVPLDPSVSFDGKKVLFSVYRGRQFNSAWWNGTTLPNQQLGSPYEAQLYIVEISTGKVTALIHSPGDGDYSPVWLPDGRIMFASDRAGTRQPWLYRLTPTGVVQPQLYIADSDGSNATNITPHELATAMHPYVLNNGRVAYSSQWLSHNLAFVSTNGGINWFTTTDNLWMISDIDLEGGDTTALLGAHRSHGFYDAVRTYPRNFKALHFVGQRNNNDICSANYYRGNNLGLGEVFCWTPEKKGVEGKPGSFLPRNLYNVAAWATSNDQRSWNINGIYQGKISYPEGIANNQLMLTVGRGYCATVSGSVPSFQDDVANQPGKLACDTGIYHTTQIPSIAMSDLRLIVDRPEWHEFSARAVKTRTVKTPQLNIVKDGRCIIASSDAGSAETSPHFSYQFNKNYKTSANQGGQIDGLDHDELYGIRFWEVIPNRGKRPANLKSAIGNDLKLLGDVALLADKSFAAELPCDTPYIMAGIDINGNVIMRDQIPQSLRPGEERVCTGCHLHSKQGKPYDQSLAYTTQPTNLTVAQAVPTFEQDIKPIFQQHCASCHTNDVPVLDYDKLVWDFFQTYVPDNKKVQVSTSTNINHRYGLHRPYISKYVNNMFARESLLYWKAANKRMDGRTDTTYTNDIDFGSNHPTNISKQQLKTLGLWLDSGTMR